MGRKFTGIGVVLMRKWGFGSELREKIASSTSKVGWRRKV